MGMFDFITGGSGPEKAQKLKKKITEKYGDPNTRQKAISQLGNMNSPEALAVLMHRFTINVDPGTTDADEKDTVFQIITSAGDAAVAPVRDFLKRQEQASSWALKILESLVDASQMVGIVTDELHHLGTNYTRDPEKKSVLLQYLEGKSDERIAPEVALFLEDHSDDVKLAALKTLGPLKYEPAREPMLKLLTDDETGKRVQTAVVGALAESGFKVQGFREKVEKRLVEPWYLDGSGTLKRRGATAP